MKTNFLIQRTEILQQMAAIQTMEEGSLKAEYRTSSSGGQTHQGGPYYKHQVWEDGGNVSRRIPAEEAPALEAAISNRQRCEELSAQFIDVTVTETRAAKSTTSQKKTSNSSSHRKKKSH